MGPGQQQGPSAPQQDDVNRLNSMVTHTTAIPILLASASPRRRQLLALLGVSFEVVASNVDEVMLPGELPADLAQRLSLVKAKAIASVRHDAIVIAADTLVTLDGKVLGKPSSEKAAFEMLTHLRGRAHCVYSGLSVIDITRGRRCTQVAVTSVHMRDYADDEIHDYIANDDPFDKAGGYAIQNPVLDPVACIDGCYANVMGLPMCHLYRILRAWDVRVPVHPLDCCPLAIEKDCRWSSKITEMPIQEWCSRPGVTNE